MTGTKLKHNWIIRICKCDRKFELYSLEVFWVVIITPNVSTTFCHSLPSCKMLQMNHISGLRRQVKRGSFKPPKLVKVCLFTYNHSIRSHFPSMGFSATGGKNCQHVCGFNSHVSCQLCASSTIFTVNRIRKWKRVKIEHGTKISPLHVNLYSLNMTSRSRWQ